MTSETAPRKYAAALLRQLAPAETAKAAAALATLAQVMEAVPALARYCAHPQVARADKEALLADMLKKAEAPASVQRFVVLLLDQGQLAMLPVIAKSLQSEIDKTQGVQAVAVSSAAPLSEAQKKRLTDDLALRLKAKLRMTFTVDPALLGGVIVKTDNRALDGSVQGRLNNLREKLLAD
jgi:F-type H+-transporting ATPase subunit delta